MSSKGNDVKGSLTRFVHLSEKENESVWIQTTYVSDITNITLFLCFIQIQTPNTTSSPKGNDRSPESNVPTSSHFKQASK